MTAPPAKWAVVVGVDHYPNDPPNFNLRGCVNDALWVYHYLCNDLGAPKSHIHLMLSRAPNRASFSPELTLNERGMTAVHESRASSAAIPREQPANPHHFIKALENIQENAYPGDSVYIHFSGHGDRVQTSFPDRKGSQAKDELLCFPDGDLPDIEFGDILDEMAKKELAVFTTLDCCFSGGATRGPGLPAIRSKSRDQEPAQIPVCQDQYDDAAVRHHRHAELAHKWLFQGRQYSAMTACGPYEKSVEDMHSSGKIYGAFTSSLIEQLVKLGYLRSSTTYSGLHGYLRATMRDKLAEQTRQQPMLFGLGNRTLFEAYDGTHEFASVIKETERSFDINRGKIHGAKLGDVYTITEPSNPRGHTQSSIDVVLRSVRDLESTAQLLTGSTNYRERSHDRCGWPARLIERTEYAHAQIRVVDAMSFHVAEWIQSEWEHYVNPIAPVCLVFPGNREYDETPFNFIVDIGLEVRIRRPDGSPFEHIPDLPSASPNVTEKLMSYLNHLQTYLNIFNMETPKNLSAQQPFFQLTFEPYEEASDSQFIVSSWVVNFKSLSNKTLFLTILNLNPLYGVQQVYPGEDEVCAIEPNESLDRPVIIDIKVPPELNEQYWSNTQFRMCDVLKSFVTMEQVRLSHFEQDDLKDTGGIRHAETRKVGLPTNLWGIHSEYIITRARGQHNFE